MISDRLSSVRRSTFILHHDIFQTTSHTKKFFYINIIEGSI